MRFMKGLSLRLCRGAMYVGHMVLMVCFEDGSYFPFCRDACFDFDAACQCIHRPPLFDLGLFFCLCSFYPSFATHSSSLFPSTFFTLLSFHFPSLAASLRSSSHFSRLGIKTAVITNRLSELDTYPVGTLLCLADWS